LKPPIKRRGYFKELVERILKEGYNVKVPAPLPGMLEIVEHLGFKETQEYDDNFGEDVDVWVKEALNGQTPIN
jgi:hypothetical protein